MMDPELMRLAQEQMSRIPPEELARMQQQMMSNPELIKLAAEGMKNMRTEDFKRAAEQFKQTRPEEMIEIGHKMAKAKPDEIVAMKAHADAQISYELSGAKMLKQQGNELHSSGQYHAAAKKYMLAKNNLKSIPTSAGQTLQLQCSLNLMSCYLKTRQFEECIQEGLEVLAYDSKNVKALYRRGQAYKELGNLEAAVVDLNKAHEISPDDETIADILRDAKGNLIKDGKARSTSQGIIIEEIVEEDTPVPRNNHTSSSAGYSVTQSVEAAECLPDTPSARESLPDTPSAIRSFQSHFLNTNSDTPDTLGMQGMSPEMVKAATDMIRSVEPEELHKMFQVASSLNDKGTFAPRLGMNMPEMTPEMFKMAADTISNFSPDELQKMLNVASSLDTNSKPSSTSTRSNLSQGRESDSWPSKSPLNPIAEHLDEKESKSDGSSSRASTSTTDVQETLRNSMNDPAMRQMFTSMMKNMSPEMMANMSEQFGMKLSKEDAAKAQQAMSSLSPEDLDRMLRLAEKAQRGVEAVKKTKNWLFGRPGLILAIVMLILAFILHQLGFIGA